jgi:hypothetical protein
MRKDATSLTTLGRGRSLIQSRPQLREPLRRLLTAVGVHRAGSQDDIAIISCKRAGSTWLMHMVAATPGIRSVNEPDLPELVAKGGLPTGLEGVLDPPFRKVLEVPIGTDEQFRSYYFDRHITRIRGPYDPFSPSFHLLTHRRVLKIVHGTAIAEWLAKQRLRPVYLVRHPISSALSMARAGAIPRAEANLRHSGFRTRFLDDDLVELGWSILEHGSPLERSVLEWCLDNVGPLRAVKKRPERWIVLSYEELMLSAERLIPLLGRRLELRHPERMFRVLRTPSPSTHNESQAKLKQMEPLQQLALWRQSVDRETEVKLFQIVERFGIDVYQPGTIMPTRPYQNLN